jgi:hypothetical protein
MTRALVAIALAGNIVAGVTVGATEVRADNGSLAAGVVGGLAIGTILGATAAAPRYYAPPPPPPPVYVAPAPIYVAPPRCYWTYGEPVWDGWRGAWVRPRMQVCN